MKRRDFVNWVGLGLVASSLPVAIAACQSARTTPAPEATTPAESELEVDNTPREDGFAAVGTVGELDDKGFISDKDFLGTQVVVIRDPANATALLAMDSLCTHQGCSVEWDSGSNAFACPCHGSKFNTDGSVLEGPATAPLGNFAAKIEDDLVLVKVS